MDAKDGEDDDDQLILLPGQTDAYVLRVRKFCKSPTLSAV